MSCLSSIKVLHVCRLLPLLGSDLAIVLNVDVVVGRETVDLVLGELGAIEPSVAGTCMYG
jgi:hypothetical protein